MLRVLDTTSEIEFAKNGWAFGRIEKNEEDRNEIASLGQIKI